MNKTRYKLSTGYRPTDAAVLFRISHGFTLRQLCESLEDLVNNGDITAGDMECSIVDQGICIYVERDSQGIRLRPASSYYQDDECEYDDA